MLYVSKDILPNLPQRAVMILSMLPIEEQMFFEAVYYNIPIESRHFIITSRLILQYAIQDRCIQEILRDDPPWTGFYY